MQDKEKLLNKWEILGICIIAVLLVAMPVILLQFAGTQENAPDGTIDLQLQGERRITTEYGQPYREPGISAKNEAGEKLQVTTEGKVDTNALGTYKLKYVARKDGTVATAYRLVTVVDTMAPTITLEYVNGAYTMQGQPYQEEGFSATDNHDGDLTASVQKVEIDGIVTYSVTDSSGNKATATRKVVYYDPVPPVITLNGTRYMGIHVGESFLDPGVKASDDLDGDLTELVTVNGSVDENTPGVYTLEYVAKDTFGNETRVKRTVCVLSNTNEPIVPSNGSVIYLTFDDGPGNHTGRLLDILKKYNVKVTFFVVNTGNIGIVGRAAGEGHTVAIHSATHRFEQIYASDEAFFNDLYRMQGIIAGYTGQTPMLMRFPGGSSNSISKDYNEGIMSRLTKEVVARGFCYFDWNVDSGDAGRVSTAEAVFENVTKGISGRKASVVLQHDIFGYSVDAVEQIILWGLANGYTFAALTPGSPGCHHGVYN